LKKFGDDRLHFLLWHRLAAVVTNGQIGNELHRETNSRSESSNRGSIENGTAFGTTAKERGQGFYGIEQCPKLKAN
jgi:hypothetical protein